MPNVAIADILKVTADTCKTTINHSNLTRNFNTSKPVGLTIEDNFATTTMNINGNALPQTGKSFMRGQIFRQQNKKNAKKQILDK